MEGLVALIALLVLYFLPSVIGVSRAHNNTAAIIVINIFLGWTFIGWVVALAWSFTHNIKANKGNSNAD